MQNYYLTPEGLLKLKRELEYLKTVKRKEIVQRIEKAKDLGDLSENAEYQAAREEQSFSEGRISELEYMVRHAVLIEPRQGGDMVDLGSTVRVKMNGGEKVFFIVGAAEANPLDNKISNESPLGQALLGRRVGEETECLTPRGPVRCTVVEIT